MPDREAILSAEFVADVVEQWGVYPPIKQVGDSHEALRERVAVLTEERDFACTQLRNALDHRHAENDRVAVLEAGLQTVRALVAPMDNAPDTVDPILAKVMLDLIDDALGGVPATKEEQT